ncbi:GNAT family N-acetyltransferase [Streptosporangiaceae bacterium NEAU-GS5]|nr:GNAT family N-acetyltransferase [Streptosporangiaceae bacterium NEAU-GS5]
MPSDTLHLSAELTLRHAAPDDLSGVLALLAETADWLNGLGVRQWPVGGFPAARIAPLIDEGVMYVLDGEDGSGPVATMALDGNADAEFWTPGDLPGGAFYVHKLAVRRSHAGLGVGEALLDWAGLRVAAAGRRWLRLDCAKDNPRLQHYYRDQRFHHVRTVDLAHRASGALFERGAALRGPGRALCRFHDLTTHLSSYLKGADAVLVGKVTR